MKKILGLTVFLALTLALSSPVLALAGNGRNAGFVHGIVIPVDGINYYMAGPADGPMVNLMSPSMSGC